MKKKPPKLIGDEVGEEVSIYGLRGVVVGGVVNSAKGSLAPEQEALLIRMNASTSRQALRRAFESSPAEFGQAAVDLARKP